METATIDPKEIKVLLLFHPAGITPETEFAIDQYLLNGGTVVACLDAFSVAAQMTGGGNPMMGSSRHAHHLHPAHPALRMGRLLRVRPRCSPIPRSPPSSAATASASPCSPSRKDSMPQKDNVITKDLESVTFFLPGAFTKTGGGGVAANTLIKSTTDAGFVDSMRASQLDPDARPRTFQSDRHRLRPRHPSLRHLQDRLPRWQTEGQPAEEAKAADEKKDEPKPASLKEGAAPATSSSSPMSMPSTTASPTTCRTSAACRWPSPSNGNASLLFNLLDQAVGSKHLIGSRSRSAIRRPFTVVQKMEADFNKTGRRQDRGVPGKTKGRPTETQRTPGPEDPAAPTSTLSPAQEAEITQAAQGTGRILQAHPRAGKRPPPPEGQTRRQDHPAQRRRHAAPRRSSSASASSSNAAARPGPDKRVESGKLRVESEELRNSDPIPPLPLSLNSQLFNSSTSSNHEQTPGYHPLGHRHRPRRGRGRREAQPEQDTTRSATQRAAGQTLFESFPATDVSTIEIQGAAGTVTLAKKDGKWTVVRARRLSGQHHLRQRLHPHARRSEGHPRHGGRSVLRPALRHG